MIIYLSLMSWENHVYVSVCMFVSIKRVKIACSIGTVLSDQYPLILCTLIDGWAVAMDCIMYHPYQKQSDFWVRKTILLLLDQWQKLNSGIMKWLWPKKKTCSHPSQLNLIIIAPNFCWIFMKTVKCTITGADCLFHSVLLVHTYPYTTPEMVSLSDTLCTKKLFWWKVWSVVIALDNTHVQCAWMEPLCFRSKKI